MSEADKTRDKNVRNIEKDIKRCEQLTKPEHANWIGISNQLAISHILAELEQKDKQIKDLEEENYVQKTVIFEKCIPIQVIIDKIEEINNNKPYLMKFKDWGEKEYTNEDIIDNCVQVLQELLEGESK